MLQIRETETQGGSITYADPSTTQYWDWEPQDEIPWFWRQMPSLYLQWIRTSIPKVTLLRETGWSWGVRESVDTKRVQDSREVQITPRDSTILQVLGDLGAGGQPSLGSLCSEWKLWPNRRISNCALWGTGRAPHKLLFLKSEHRGGRTCSGMLITHRMCWWEVGSNCQ